MMQVARQATKSLSAGRRLFGTAQATHVTYNDMKKTKHDFVHFVDQAILDRSSPEAKELYHYLNKCFTDNDTDYDGLVSYRGFNAMIAEAAVAPRRFGFAPHTREMYKSAAEYDLARTELFNKIRGNGKLVTMDGWINWAMNHIKEKVGSGLKEHGECKWERSKSDCIQFFKDVGKQGSSHNRKSSQSTQYKEFYVFQNDLFMEVDKSMTGLLDKTCFDDLVKKANAVPMKFGMDWYKDAKFESVAKDGKVGWKQWKEYSLKLVTEKSALA